MPRAGMTGAGTTSPVIVAALGAPGALAGYELAGARLVPARTPEEVRAAWAGLPADTAVVLLTPEAAAVLADSADGLDSAVSANSADGLDKLNGLDDPASPLTVTLPS